MGWGPTGVESEMTIVYCPKCAVTTTVRQECAPCKATGFRWVNLRNPDTTIHPVKRECKKCQGRGLIEKPVTYKNEMIFIHPQEADPSRWVCRKCNYQMYTKDSHGVFEVPEEKLPPMDAIALKEAGDKNDQDTVKDYIKRRFGP